jgi:hypothetical protein
MVGCQGSVRRKEAGAVARCGGRGGRGAATARCSGDELCGDRTTVVVGVQPGTAARDGARRMAQRRSDVLEAASAGGRWSVGRMRDDDGDEGTRCRLRSTPSPVRYIRTPV